MSLSVLPTMFAPEERRKGIAIMSAATMLSFPIGPILGGYLLGPFWGGWVFLFNVSVLAIALVAVLFLLPESRSASRPSIDVLGVLVSSAGLIAVTYGCIKAGQNGWGNAAALATIAVGLVLLALFVFVERRITARGGQSLVDLALFPSVGFRWGTILVTFLSFAMFGLFFALPQYFQNVRGADSLGSGLRLLPMVLGMVIGMVVGTRLQSVRGGSEGTPGKSAGGRAARVPGGYLVVAIGLAIGAFTTLSSSTWFTLAWVAVAGLGFGL